MNNKTFLIIIETEFFSLGIENIYWVIMLFNLIGTNLLSNVRITDTF